MTPKLFNHNGGSWTRPDIPSATPVPWKCHKCGNDVDYETEEYQPGTFRYVPASRYWHNNLVGVQYCGAICSNIHHQELNAKPEHTNNNS